MSSTMMGLKYNGSPQLLFQGEETGGGAALPSATPSGSPTPDVGSSPSAGSGTTPDTPSTPSSDGDIYDFESIFSGGEDGADLGLTPPPATKPATPPPVPPTPPVPPVQATQPPPQAPAVEQQPPVQPAAAQPPVSQAEGPAIPAQLDRYDPAQLVQALVANEAALTETLARQVFALSPQETEALETNVVEAIPRLMARVLMQAQKSALTQMAQMLPVIIQRHGMVMQVADSNESQFYAAVPGLNKAQHGRTVYQYATMFRRMHPQATLQDMIRYVGPMVQSVVGVTPGLTAPAPGRAPTTQGNGRSPPPSPFVPAGGRGPASPAAGAEVDPWSAVFGHEG